MKIKSIKKNVNKKHTYDIEVKNERHYIFENGCVSHNSSVVSNSTNGIEPPRGLVSIKKSKQGLIKMVVPEIYKLKNKYKLAFDVTNDEYTNVQSVIQKWIDQGISGNHYYDLGDGEELSIARVAKDLLNFYKYGGKQLYYANTADGKSDDFTEIIDGVKVEEVDESCESGACSI